MLTLRRGSEPWYYADISDWQADVDLAQYASAGHVTIAIKRTQGTREVQATGLQRADDAHRAGLRVGHYHYCELGSQLSWRDEAEHFAMTIGTSTDPGDWLMADWETDGNVGAPNAAHWLAQFCAYVTRTLGMQVKLYSSLSWLTVTKPTVVVPGNE